jgi:hypothetical protein
LTAYEEKVPCRQGNRLIIPVGCGLPPFCLKCGQPATTYKEQTLALPDPSKIPFYLIGLVAVNRVRLFLPLCSEHLWRSRVSKFAGVLLMIASIPVGLAVGDETSSLAGVVAFVGTFVSGAILWLKGEVLHAKSIDDNEIVLTGAAEEFLSMLKPQSIVSPH